MIKVMFVDDRPDEVLSQWQKATAEMLVDLFEFHLLAIEVFDTTEKTLQSVITYKPDIIFIGFGLSSKISTGADVIHLLREHDYPGLIAANSGGSIGQFTREGIELDIASVNKSPEKLKNFLKNFLIFHADNKA
jgi:hypothetical protein